MTVIGSEGVRKVELIKTHILHQVKVDSKEVLAKELSYKVAETVLIVSNTMKLKIESTETGEVFNMRLESSIDKLKFQVSLLIPIPPQDQIMLIGPPYKILDSLYGPTMDLEGRRIFVFNRRILSDSTKEPQRIRLLPYEVSKPELTYDPQLDHALGSPRGDNNDSSAHVKTREFEHYFQTQLKKSQCLEMYIQESYKSCKTCVAQHQVQLDGIGAAISNLQYFHRSIHKSYVALEGKLIDQQSHHASLLENFESGLQALGEVPLHPAIRAAIEDYSMNASTAVSGQQAAVGVAAAGVSNVSAPGATVSVSTLLDCVSVKIEREYLAQCWAIYKQVEENLRRVRGLHQEVQAGVQELQLPSVDFSSLQHDLDSINQESAAAADLMRRFRRDYHFVYQHITHSASPSRQSQADAAAAVAAGETFTPSAGEQGDAAVLESEANDASGLSAQRDGSGTAGVGGPIDSVFDDRTATGGSVAESFMSTAATVSPRDTTERVLGELQRRKNAQEGAHYLEMLESCAKRVREAKANVERSQNWLLGAIYRTMRQIAMLQTDIQYKLKPDVGWMKKLTQGHNEYFVHLEKIEQLSVIYQHLLNEIARRRSYNDLFEAEVIAASERISAFRSEETRQRELFMQKYGLHLPSVFFKAIPTLKDKPPYFSPTLTDAQWLPEVGYDDVNRDYITGEFSTGESISKVSLKSATGGISSATVEGDGDTVSSTGADRSAVSTRTPAEVSATPISDSKLTAMLHRYGGRSDASDMSQVSEGRPQQQAQSQRNSVTAMSGGRPNVADSQCAADSAGDMGGSVILRAVPRDSDDSGYQKLVRQCSKLEYDNAQYISIIADLRAQLANNSSSGKQQQQQDSITAAPETASINAAAPETNKVTEAVEATPPASVVADSAVKSADDSTGHRTEQEPCSKVQPTVASASPAKVSSEEELQGKLNRVGTLNQLMHGYAQLRDLMKSDTTTQAYIAELESHSLLEPLPEERVLYSGNETYIEPPSGAIVPVRDTAQSVLSGVHALLNALSLQLRQPRISFTAFRAGDIALFMPVATDNRKIWMAFHANTPYRYLAEDSLLSFQQRSKNREQRAHIIGRIFLIDRKESSLEENPYNLALGTEYFVCYVEPLRTGGGGKKNTVSSGIKAAAGEKVSGTKAISTATAPATTVSAVTRTETDEALDQLTAKVQD